MHNQVPLSIGGRTGTWRGTHLVTLLPYRIFRRCLVVFVGSRVGSTFVCLYYTVYAIFIMVMLLYFTDDWFGAALHGLRHSIASTTPLHLHHLYKVQGALVIDREVNRGRTVP